MDTVQDIFYDIFGFIIPGLIVIFLGYVYYLSYSIQKVTLIDFMTFKNFNNIETLLSRINVIEISTTLMYILIIFAYLIGAGTNAISKMIYKITYKRFYDKEKIFKNYRTILSRYYHIEFDEELENIIYEKEPSLIRKVLRNDKCSLISKYIAKYNFFLSVKFIFLILLIPYEFFAFKELLKLSDLVILFIVLCSILGMYGFVKVENELTYFIKNKYQNLKIFFLIITIYLAISSMYSIGIIYGIITIIYILIFTGMLRESQRHIDLRDTEQNILLVYRMLENNKNELIN